MCTFLRLSYLHGRANRPRRGTAGFETRLRVAGAAAQRRIGGRDSLGAAATLRTGPRAPARRSGWTATPAVRCHPQHQSAGACRQTGSRGGFGAPRGAPDARRPPAAGGAAGAGRSRSGRETAAILTGRPRRASRPATGPAALRVITVQQCATRRRAAALQYLHVRAVLEAGRPALLTIARLFWMRFFVWPCCVHAKQVSARRTM